MVFYFSGTGNSLAVAKRIAQARKEQLVDMAVALRQKKYFFNIGSGESIGIVCPIYFWGLPTLVISFLQQMQLPAQLNPFVYAVFTCGGSIGDTDRQLAEVLDNRGYALGTVYSVKMPDNYILTYNLLPPEKRIEEILAASEGRIVEIIEAIKVHRPVENLIDRGRFPRLATFFAYHKYKNGRSTEPFYANSACNGCGLCEKICPIDAIRLYDKHPVWMAPKCVTCLACLHRCPQQAIQYGSKTEKRRRYVHPELKGSNKVA